MNEKASHEETKRICFALRLTVISPITDCSSRNAVLLCGAGYRREAVLSHQEKFPFAVWQVIVTQTVHHHELLIFECLWLVCKNMLCIRAYTFCIYVFGLREVLASEVLLNIPMRADWRECKCTKEEEEDQAKQMRSDFVPFDFALNDWATFQKHLTWSLHVNELNQCANCLFYHFMLFKFCTIYIFLFLSFATS